MKKFTEIVANIREVKEPTGKLKDACWKGYTAVGMKMKNGRKVPNCVPVGEQFESDKPEPGREAVDGRFVAQPSKSVTKPAPQATPKNEEAEHLDEMPGANMDTVAVHRHLRKGGWSLTRTKGGHDVYTHPKSEKHIAVPRHRQLKAPLVRGIMKDAQVSEDVDQLDEISQQTKQSYLQKAKDQVKELEPHAKSGEYRDIAKNMMNRREAGIKKAEVTESRGHKIIATKLAQIEARRKQEQEIAKRIEQERKQNEPVKPVKEEKGSWQKETDWKKAKPEPVDKSGAKHSAMSRVKHLAKMASRKRVLEQDNDNQVDNVRTPAKQSLAFRGVVKNMAKSTKGKKLASDDKFQDEPELNTQIMRNNF
jgi:predicted RNA binding protein YcfA (HicA-like mRNA interferase family)